MKNGFNFMEIIDNLDKIAKEYFYAMAQLFEILELDKSFLLSDHHPKK